MPQIIAFILPAIIALFFYKAISRSHMTVIRYIIIAAGFALVINLLTICSVWLMGYTGFEWLYDGTILRLSFYIKYLVLSIVFAFVLVLLLTGLRKMHLREKINKALFLILPIIFLAVLFGTLILVKYELVTIPGIMSGQNNDIQSDDNQDTQDDSLISSIYILIEKQTLIEEKLLAELNSGVYSFNDPLIVVDPYDISPLTALVLFTSDEPMNISIHISGKTGLADEDFTFDGFNTEHILPVYGLYPDEYNNVEINATTVKGNNYKKTIEIKTEPLPPELAKNTIRIDLNYEDKYQPGLNFTYTQKTAFDVNGDYRWFINDFKLNRQALYNYNGNMIITKGAIFEGDVLFLTINPLGKILEVYYSPYGVHHDIIDIGSNILLISGCQGETIYDFIYEIDVISGEIINTLDLKTVLQWSRSGFAPLYSSEDWFHHNATVYDEGSIIVSGRDQSAVIKLSWPEGEIDWILSNHEGWDPIYHDFLLTPTGIDFKWPYSQHAPEILPDYDNDPDTIDILLFDNGYGRISDSSSITSGDYSRMVHYRINEKTKTIEQIWEFGEELGEDYFAFLAGDADLLENGNLLGTFDRDDPLNTPIYTSFVEVDSNGEIIWEAYATSNDSDGTFKSYRLERRKLYNFTANDLYIGVQPRNLIPDGRQ